MASFAGSADYSSANSDPLTFNIIKATSTVTVSDAGGTYTGSPYPASAKVNGTAGLEGTTPVLMYYAGSTATGSPLSGAPSAAGTYTVVASFAGSADYSLANSNPLTFNITKATPTVTVSDACGTYTGSPYAASAKVNGSTTLEGVAPTLTYYSGATATGTPLSGAPGGAGTYTVVASFAGSADYATASSGPLTFNITKATPTVTVTDAGGTYTGSPYPASAKVNGTASLEGITPTLTYYVGSTAIGTPLSGAPSAVGTYTVVASFAGSADYSSATSGPVTFKISSVSTLPLPTVTVTDSGGVYTGCPYPATAKVNDKPSLDGIKPVLMYYSGTTATGTPLSGAPSAAGTYTVVASFAGSTHYAAASSSPLIFTISKAKPRLTVSACDEVFNGKSASVVALVNGRSSLEGVSLTLVYYSGTTHTGTPLSAAPSAVGTYTVVASFAGSADYAAATTSITFTIRKATPKLTVTDASGTYTGNPFTATASINGAATLEGIAPTLTYYSGRAPTGKPLSGAPRDPGTYTVVASFAGSADYNAVISTPVVFTISKASTKLVISKTGGVITGTVCDEFGNVVAAPIFHYYLASDSKHLHPLSGPPTAPGSYVVIVSFAGNSDYLGCSIATIALTITKN